ncbi:MAG: anaerobic sulfatase-maturation protein [Muribaculaceae bacterium]|nr:anaerobic sulfatase-maturation protein [Muribaculaceae bacterium]
MTEAIPSPFSRPLYVMTKPAGSACNLACKYCYYLEKDKLYRGKGLMAMTDDVLERFISSYLVAQTSPQALFCWHGGEALMRPISFYKKVMELQRRYGRGMMIENSIQTNGTMLTDAWCEFFRENGWLVGVSVDGPREFHDAYRRTRTGAPSFAKVMAGVKLLQKHSVEWNALAVVNRLNADHPFEFYDFFRSIGCRYIQFTPVVERLLRHDDGRMLASPAEQPDAPLADFSVTPQQWGSFLCGVFDEWVRHDVGTYYVQLFDALLANWVGVTPGLCTMAETCGHAGVMEYNGDVYCCDHFVFPEFKLGNIREQTLVEMMGSARQEAFGAAKRDALPGQCRRCPYLFACHGECPRNRFASTAEGEPGLNYLCEGYRTFFEHAAPYFDFMKAEYQAGRAPANVMGLFR